MLEGVWAVLADDERRRSVVVCVLGVVWRCVI